MYPQIPHYHREAPKHGQRVVLQAVQVLASLTCPDLLIPVSFRWTSHPVVVFNGLLQVCSTLGKDRAAAPAAWMPEEDVELEAASNRLPYKFGNFSPSSHVVSCLGTLQVHPPRYTNANLTR